MEETYKVNTFSKVKSIPKMSTRSIDQGKMTKKKVSHVIMSNTMVMEEKKQTLDMEVHF